MNRLHLTGCVLMLACGERGSLTVDAFALHAKVSGTNIELTGNYAGAPIDDTTCTYRVDGNDLRFEIAWRGHRDGCVGTGHESPVMLTVQCRGPRLAPGHYRVSEGIIDAAGLMLLEGDVDPTGSGELVRRMQ